MKGIILHGRKLLPQGHLSPDMRKRIASMVSLLNNDYYDVLVITGGVTNKLNKSEAEVIFNDIKHLVNIQVLLEDRSKTTLENIKNTRELIESSNCDHFSVITSKCSVRRFKRLYKLYMPEHFHKLSFEGAENTSTFVSFLMEAVLYAISIIDPKERLMRPFIKLFRS